MVGLVRSGGRRSRWIALIESNPLIENNPSKEVIPSILKPKPHTLELARGGRRSRWIHPCAPPPHTLQSKQAKTRTLGLARGGRRSRWICLCPATVR